MNDWKSKALVPLLIIVVIIPLVAVRYKKTGFQEIMKVQAVYVGSNECIACHTNEHKDWLKSHHAHAMSVASDSTVLGDFDNSTFIFKGDTHKFYKRDNKFYTYTRGTDGKMQEYEITHTFGYTPLQQYLIPFEHGKLQCLPIVWDTEKKEWYNMAARVYNIDEVSPDDWLYWTNQSQNWNGMCAECHSTNLQKNYIAESDSFNTTWSEINVSCEACHGPGSKHIEWADLPEIRQHKIKNFGLIEKTSDLTNEEYVELCARCHARRSQISDYKAGNKNLLDYMIPSILQEHYFVDGQILDEDYVWGSFVQSKMYHNDIKCNDCHNVHSGERLFEGNAVCTQCHVASYYDTPKHHFHKTGEFEKGTYKIGDKDVAIGEGAQCVNCHMPGRYYMGNDFRNDHSLRKPRPDLSKKLGVPNACNQCHTDQTVDWAISYTEKWYGIKELPHYGSLLALEDSEVEKNIDDLLELINNDLNPAIARASALEKLSAINDTLAAKTIVKSLDDPESLIRLSAIRTYYSQDVNTYIENIAPLLKDPARAVRMEAALRLSYIPEDQMAESIKPAYKKALNECIDYNTYMADFPGGMSNLALINTNMGNYQKAINLFKKAIETDNEYYQAYANLAYLYNQTGQNENAEKIYLYLIQKEVNLPGIEYSLGLLNAEQNKYPEATKYLEKAIEKDPHNGRINYNLGLIYMQLNEQAKAETNLKEAVAKETENSDFAYALAHYYVSTQQINKARKYLNEIASKFPNNQDIKQLLVYLNGK